MNKALLAKSLGWGQLAVTALDASINAHGIPTDAHQWLPIFGSAIMALAIHHAASTDGLK